MSYSLELPAAEIAYVCDIHFHRSFVLPANTTHGRPKPIRVSYADLDYRIEQSTNTGPTLLYIPGYGGTRYRSLGFMDRTAKKFGIRLIIADNFGIGGTDKVSLQYRVLSWTDLISELLNHLQIKHVALASHSAGVIYLFNAALQLRQFLHPLNPMVFIFAPWVPPPHSRLFPFIAARYLPKIILRKAYWPCKYVGHASVPKKQGHLNLPHMGRKECYCYCHQATHVNALAFATECRRLEHYSGMGEDALLCLRRGQGKSWGCFSDFDEAVQRLRLEEQRRQTTSSEIGNPLRVEVTFAAKDGITDWEGMAWFDTLWAEHKDWVQYNSVVVQDARHNEVVNKRLAWMMQEVSRLHTSDGVETSHEKALELAS